MPIPEFPLDSRPLRGDIDQVERSKKFLVHIVDEFIPGVEAISIITGSNTLEFNPAPHLVAGNATFDTVDYPAGAVVHFIVPAGNVGNLVFDNAGDVTNMTTFEPVLVPSSLPLVAESVYSVWWSGVNGGGHKSVWIQAEFWKSAV